MAPPADAPDPEEFRDVFRTYEVREGDERVFYFGNPLAPRTEVVDAVESAFGEAAYEVSFEERPGELVLVAEPETGDAFPWANLSLFFGTLASTLYFGTVWYHQPLNEPADLLAGLPFSAAVMFVLACHEFGHYFASKYHEVDASLPYFIPAPTFIGTMGAVISIRNRMPDRKALFDIGVAGPIAGLVATVIVTAIGLSMDPVTVPQRVLESEGAIRIELGWPPLLRAIAWVLGEPLVYEGTKSINPVVIGGWLGMFLTLLNLIPVGQLDGGHIVRAIVGPRAETIAAAVPVALFGLGGYLHFIAEVPSGAGIWVFWGLLTSVFAYLGAADPIRDDPIDTRRKVVGIATLAVGLLCFTPVPLQVLV
jgi:membrane-associated protease RseP (regulator of RpoE activity)